MRCFGVFVGHLLLQMEGPQQIFTTTIWTTTIGVQDRYFWEEYVFSNHEPWILKRFLSLIEIGKN